MNFGEAVEAMKQGKSVINARWQKPTTTVVSAHLVPATEEHEEFIAWVLANGTWEPMTYSHANVLAEDWMIHEGP